MKFLVFFIIPDPSFAWAFAGLCQCLYSNKYSCVCVSKGGRQRRLWEPVYNWDSGEAQCWQEPLCSVIYRADATLAPKELRAWLYTFVSSAINTARCKKLQDEKEDLERRLEEEARKLRWQQKEELQVLEQRLHEDYSAKIESLQEQHKLQLEIIKSQHLHQVSSSLLASEKQTMPVLSGFR